MCIGIYRVKFLTNSWSNSSNWSRARYISSHSGCLSCSGGLSRGGLLLHLSVALTEVEHLAERGDVNKCPSAASTYYQQKCKWRLWQHGENSLKNNVRAECMRRGHRKRRFDLSHSLEGCPPSTVQWLCAHLDVSAGVYFVHSVSRGSAGFSVQVVTLNKHCVVTEASHPHIPLPLTLQLNPFANVKPGREETTGRE